MPQFGLLILVHIFSALLPPVDAEETSYYDILDVSRTATSEEVRKAYKKLSLKLHPDKVAQRGNKNAQTAAEEYEKVQEAYGILANEHKRATYDALKTPTRYRFYAQGALANPGALYENLTSASLVDKTRLMGFVTVLIMLILTQPILICAKINQDLQQNGGLQDASWFAVFIPYWMVGGLVLLFTALLVPFMPIGDRLPLCLSVIEQFLWYLSMIFLCFRWDQTWTSPYRQIFVPVYLAMLLRWLQAFVMMRKIRTDVQKMVTVEFLEREVLKGKSVEDLEEAELQELQHNFLVVTVPPDFQPVVVTEDGIESDEEKIETQKVEASPEFEAASEIYNKTVTGVVNSIIFGTIFLILMTRKLDAKSNASWWVVFIPIFLERGFRWLLNFYRCACGHVDGDEIIVQMTTGANDGQEGKDNAKNGNNETEENQQSATTDKSSKDKELAEKALPSSPHDKVEQETKDPQKQNDTKPVKAEKKAKSAMESTSVKEGTETTSAKESTETTSTKETTEKPSTTKSTNTKGSLSEEKDSTKDTPKDEKQKDSSDNIHIDEETFKAWQNAYAEAEETAMQEQAKASSECCNLSLQLILLCLVVAKIEQSYQSDDPNNVGFSTFWILFPFFVFFGILCCCCTLLIYGAAPGSLADLNGTADKENKDNYDPENPPSEAAVDVDEGEKEEAVHDTKQDEEKTGDDEVKVTKEGEGAMDDLD